MNGRLPGVEWVQASRTAGAYLTGWPWRLVVHTTEGWSIASALAAYRSHDGWPHLTVSHAERRVVQHIDLGTAARALRNQPGGVETNRLPCIQVEVVGFAAESWAMSDEVLAWHAQAWMRPILDAVPIRRVAPLPMVDQRDGFIARPDAPQRLSFDEWLRFSGVLGHQHVPENDHWDPGRMNLARIIDLAVGGVNMGVDKPMPGWVQPAVDAGIVKGDVSKWDDPPSKAELALMLERTGRYAAAKADAAISDEAILAAIRDVGQVDPQALAAALAPLLDATVEGLSDADLARIARAAADETDRRARERLG